MSDKNNKENTNQENNNQENKNHDGVEQQPESNEVVEEETIESDIPEKESSEEEAAEDELAILQDKLQRSFAELENTRRRFDREKQESIKYAIAGFAADIISLADNLERALQAVSATKKEQGEKQQGEKTDAFVRFVEGVALSAKELNTIFERNHIKKINPRLGEAFSPSQHQAVSEIPSDAHPKGTIVQTLQPGYTLHDRLIRPAMVMVSSGKIEKKTDITA
ncbi:MAG: nucleotide exchange factor GrpE [Alphaproteobacteria bacterium]|nr:nucleotide exchange factor GrpE [Alphaproteobacteria bacterium]